MLDMRSLINLCEHQATIVATTLYHCTPTVCLPSIQKSGLKTRIGSNWGEIPERYTSSRIFFTQDIAEARSFAEGLIAYDEQESITVLAVNIKGLEEFFKVDRNWLNDHNEIEHPAVFIEQNIEPSRISVVETIAEQDVK